MQRRARASVAGDLWSDVGAVGGLPGAAEALAPVCLAFARRRRRAVGSAGRATEG